MNRQQRPITDREHKAWLAAGAVDRGVGDGLTFVASATAAKAGRASWIFRYRWSGHSKEKVLGRYPELSLRDAREQGRQERAQIERGIDVAVAKQADKALLLETPSVLLGGFVNAGEYMRQLIRSDAEAQQDGRLRDRLAAHRSGGDSVPGSDSR